MDVENPYPYPTLVNISVPKNSKKDEKIRGMNSIYATC